jgi:hypothetical protein
MTGKTVAVDAEWALLVRAGHEGRVIACSTGELNARNFLEAIGRFDPGTPEELPQVSVSFVPTAVPFADYLAFAIHVDGSPDDRGADERLPALTTRYFCLSYYQLAAGAISYQAMYQALDPIRLPHGNAPPIGVSLAPQAPTSVRDDLALQAAALLLTTRPVCVLGAEGATVAERLAFIDAVMSLLPYGLRARMAAATWTRAADRDHRFRLFFSDTARAIDPPDNFLVWGHPGETDLTAADLWAYEYLTWLRDKASQPTARLASWHRPMRFRSEDVQPILDEIGIIGPDPRQNYSVTKQDLEPQPAPRTKTGREQILRECARHLRVGSLGEIKADISQLKTMAADPDDDDQRARYRQILKETSLLSLAETQGRNTPRLYNPLLRVAVTAPLSYEGYCQLEDCLKNPLLPKPLLQAVESAGLCDQLAAALVYYFLWNADSKRPEKREPIAKKMAEWRAAGYADADRHPVVDAAQFIHQLAAGRVRPQHALIVCDVLLGSLELKTTDRDHTAIEMALCEHGFLAGALPVIGIKLVRDQFKVLLRFLQAAYPDRLDRPEIMKVLTGTQPTPALLAAVLLHLRRPSDAHLARQAFMDGSIRGLR